MSLTVQSYRICFIHPVTCDNPCVLLPARELTRAFESRGFLGGSIMEACSECLHDWPQLHSRPPPRGKTDVHYKLITKINYLLKLVQPGPRPQTCKYILIDRTFQAQIVGASQEPVLKIGLSRECATFEQARPPELNPSLHRMKCGSESTRTWKFRRWC